MDSNSDIINNKNSEWNNTKYYEYLIAHGNTCIEKDEDEIYIDKTNQIISTPGYLKVNPLEAKITKGIIKVIDSLNTKIKSKL